MPCDRLTGKVALITGGGSGVGRATAIRFASEGCKAIYLWDRAPEKLEAVAQEVAAAGSVAIPFVGDVGVDDDCDRAIAQVIAEQGALDILLSNAPAHSSSPFLKMTREEWDRVLRINLRSSFVLGQLAARAMVQQGTRGSILFTASVSGIGASKEYAHYGAAKAGIINLVKTMAMELVDYGIRVNCVSPGPLDTPQSADVLGSQEALERARVSWPLVPMNRLGKAEEIAAAYAYLASEDAGYVTGLNLVVDGGLTSHAYSIPEELLAAK
jgi:NAD(P)-dependent dehydrogenase (short-subunit alcohol dehydrogenase family)